MVVRFGRGRLGMHVGRTGRVGFGPGGAHQTIADRDIAARVVASWADQDHRPVSQLIASAHGVEHVGLRVLTNGVLQGHRALSLRCSPHGSDCAGPELAFPPRQRTVAIDRDQSSLGRAVPTFTRQPRKFRLETDGWRVVGRTHDAVVFGRCSGWPTDFVR